MPNKLGFSRSLSGTSIADIQKAVNTLYTATGASETATGTEYNATDGTIVNGDPYLLALTKLADKFDALTGHIHSGQIGDAPPIDALRSIAVTGNPPITGNAVLIALTGMSLSQTGNNIYLSATGGTQPATTASYGTVILASSGTQSVGSSNSDGTANGLVANANHIHQGVHSVAASGSSALNGDVILKAGTGISLNQSGQNITIAASGGSGSSLNYFSGFMSATSDWSTTSNSFVDGTNSGGNTLTTIYSNGISPTAAASNVAGLTFTPAASSSVYIITANCATYSAVAGTEVNLRMTDGTTALTWSVQSNGGGIGSQTDVTLFMSAIYAPGTTSPVTVKIQMSNGAGASTAHMNAINVASGVPTIHWTMTQIN